MKTLRDELTKLAHENPDGIRAHLVPLLRKEAAPPKPIPKGVPLQELQTELKKKQTLGKIEKETSNGGLYIKTKDGLNIRIKLFSVMPPATLLGSVAISFGLSGSTETDLKIKMSAKDNAAKVIQKVLKQVTKAVEAKQKVENHRSC